MRQELAAVENLVNKAVESGDFSSREACVSALINWMVLNDYVNPSRLCNPEKVFHSGEAIEDRGARGVSEPEEALLQYEILRDRDA